MSKPTHRKMWMFPRNIRKIEAWKIVQIAQLLDACSGVTTNQEVQNDLYSQLSQLGLKVKANENGVANPGGMRTYFAQLACLGLFWKDQQKNYHTTFAGEELINARDPLKILRCQLLRMQYPSVYGIGRNVSVDPILQVKPFVFIIKLLQDERLDGYLTDKDIAVAVIYGRRFNCHDLGVDKILHVRKTDNLADIVDDVNDLRTPKRYHPNDPEADFSGGITDAHNIGNTAKNYLIATQLIVVDPDDKHKFVLNSDPAVQADILKWIDEKIEPLNVNHQEAWQMRFGRYTKTKSLRTASTIRTNGAKALVCSNFISAVEAAPFDFNLQSFIENQAKIWGKSENEIGLLISSMRSRISNIERDTIKQAAVSGGTEATKLEKATAGIFRKLGFDLTEHIGQKKAPRRGGYPDIRIRASNLNECGFGDTKATAKYEFPIADISKLKDYYKECWDEFPDQTPSSFFLYIAGGYGKKVETIEATLKECSLLHTRPVAALTVDALLDLVEMDSPPTTKELLLAFKKGGYFTTGVGIKKASK